MKLYLSLCRQVHQEVTPSRSTCFDQAVLKGDLISVRLTSFSRQRNQEDLELNPEKMQKSPTITLTLKTVAKNWLKNQVDFKET